MDKVRFYWGFNVIITFCTQLHEVEALCASPQSVAGGTLPILHQSVLSACIRNEENKFCFSYLKEFQDALVALTNCTTLNKLVRTVHSPMPFESVVTK